MAGDETTTPPAAFHEPAPLPVFTAFPDQAAPAAPDSAPPKVCDPEKYHGERNIITLGNWLFAVGRYMAFTRMDPARQVLYASTLMRGEAMLWFRSNYEHIDPSILRWADVATRLRSYFAPPNQDRRLNNEWALLRQDTTVYNYVSKLQALAMQMPTLTESAKLDKFIRGLKPKTHIEVELRDPQTTDDAYRLADHFDRIVYGYKDTFLPSTTASSNHSPWADNRGEPMQIDSLLQRRQPRSVAFNAAYPASRRSNDSRSDVDARAKGLCFNCHKPGHIARECPDKSPQNNRNLKAHYNGRAAPKRSQNSGNGRPRS
jgi:Ty3 transposon capsid-like protein/Zinc knuckle